MNFNINPKNFGFKVRRRKFGLIDSVTMFGLGILFTFIALPIINGNKVDQDWQRIDGKTIELYSYQSEGSTLYSPIVQYEIDGKTYIVQGTTGTASKPNIGKSREVAYDPIQPEHAKLIENKGIQLFPYLFPMIGIFFIILAPVLAIRTYRRSQRIKRLIQSGQKLTGVLVEVQTGGTSNNSSYKILVSATNSMGSVQNYLSDSLDGIAGLVMTDFRDNPIPIDVYVDPSNPQNYYVDISDIPNLTPDRISQLIKNATAPRSQTPQNQFPPNQQVGEQSPVPKELKTPIN